jgi:heat shock protein HslJ
MYDVISTLNILHRKNFYRDGALIVGGTYCNVLFAQLNKYDKTLSFKAHRDGSSRGGTLRSMAFESKLSSELWKEYRDNSGLQTRHYTRYEENGKQERIKSCT